MQCDQIQGLLSEYLDHALNDERRGRVDEHLSTCAYCRGELNALQGLVKRLNTLPTIEAPAGLLNRIHARQSSRFDLARAFSLLFVPFRIKLPLELAAVTITAVLIVLLVGIQQKEMPLTDGMALAPAGAPAEKKDTVKSTTRAAVAETVLDAREEYVPAAVPIQIALLLKKAPRVQASNHPKQERRQAAPVVGRSTPAMKLAEQARGGADYAPMASGHAGQVMDKSTARPVEEKALVAIRQSVHALGGKILAVEYGQPPIRVRSVTVEIPADEYVAFGAGLSDLGDLTAPLPALDRQADSARLIISFAETP